MLQHIGTWAAAFDEEGMLWLSDFNYNGLYKYDFNARKMTLEHRFNDVGVGRGALHKDMFIRGDEIFLFPLRDNKVRIYNKKTRIEDGVEICNEGYGECYTYSLNNKVWLFSNNTDIDILCFDLIEKSLSSDQKLIALCMKLVGRKDMTIVKGYYDSNIIVLNENKKELYCIDVDTYTYERICVNSIPYNIIKVCVYEDKYWFLLKESQDIYIYDKNRHSFNRYKADTQEYVDDKTSIPYSDMIEWRQELVLLNYYGKNIMRVSEKDNSLKRLFKNQEMVLAGTCNYGACYQLARVWKNSLFFIPQRATEIIECNDKMNIISKYECVIDVEESELMNMFRSIKNEGNILAENSEIETLQRYIVNIDKTHELVKNNAYGEKIYAKLR